MHVYMNEREILKTVCRLPIVWRLRFEMQHCTWFLIAFHILHIKKSSVSVGIFIRTIFIEIPNRTNYYNKSNGLEIELDQGS